MAPQTTSRIPAASSLRHGVEVVLTPVAAAWVRAVLLARSLPAPASGRSGGRFHGRSERFGAQTTGGTLAAFAAELRALLICSMVVSVARMGGHGSVKQALASARRSRGDGSSLVPSGTGSGMHSDRPIVLDVTPHGVVRVQRGRHHARSRLVAGLRPAPGLSPHQGRATCWRRAGTGAVFDQCRPGGKGSRDPDIDPARRHRHGREFRERTGPSKQSAETGPKQRSARPQPDEPGEVYRVVGPYGTVAVYAGEGSPEQADDAALPLSNVASYADAHAVAAGPLVL